MDTPTRDRLIAEYLAGPKLLRQAVQGLTPDQLTARPVAGKMSTLEVVCHLSDFEPVYVERMKRAIALDKPQVLGADENLFAKMLRYHDRNLEEELNFIDICRSHMARILKNIPLDAWDREAMHNERGPMTVEKMVTNITNHIPHHVKFIQEKRKALGV